MATKVAAERCQSQLVAIAMYDNNADTDDELSFCRGDLLVVIEVDYQGLEGWWLCCAADGQRRGLVPSNRLRLITDKSQAYYQVSLPS